MDVLLQAMDVKPCSLDTRYDYGGSGKRRQRRMGTVSMKPLGSWFEFGGQFTMMRADRADRKALV